MKAFKPLKLAAVSDIHLGNRRNKTSDIIAGLDVAFPDNEETGKLDLIVLVGDVFDRELNFPDADIYEIEMWFARLLAICSKRKIILRVLEGTRSHDWGQSIAFEKIIKHKGLELDFKYVSALSIEFIPKLGINVLYVPDDLGPPDRTLEEVKSLMAFKELTQVDYAFMHGQFEYQLPANIKGIPRHSSEEYLKLVKHYIFIGHIHVHSTYDRIIAQGSFDRLTQGEEGPKGHVRATITEDAQEHFFIENKMAKIYKSYQCKDMDLEKTLAFLREKVKKLPDGANVRVVVDKNHPILTNMNALIAMYPTIVWDKLVKDDAKTSKEVTVDDETEMFATAITKDNIVTLVTERISKTDIDSKILAHSKTLLQAAI